MKDNEVYLVFQLIQETIDCSYSDIYPDQAVEFFKAFHSETKIRNRARLGDVLLFEQDGTILATGALVKNKIEGVFVKPDFHGQGIGRNIMGELEKLASSHGFAEVELHISLPSKKFYDAMAYETLEECQDIVASGQYLKYWKARKKLYAGL